MFARVDKPLLISIIALLLGGLIVFGSAALGVLAVNEVKFYAVIKTQLVYALFGGAVALLLGMNIPYRFYMKYGYYLFGAALFVTTLVFVPGLSVYHGGAHRWIDIGSLSVQPSEALKFGFVIAVALWCSTQRNKFKDWRYGILPYILAAGVVSGIMLAQPDFGTFMVIMAASFGVFFVGGARKNHIIVLMLVGLLGVAALISLRPYMIERVKTFLNASHDPQGSSWQLNQSLIALGSGGIAGRGLGQSVQKFNYLPEPIGDSVFAVLGEELGLIGSLTLLLLYAIVGIRGFSVSMRAENQFARLLGVGIVIIILTQASLNIGSMLGLMPLTGVPLPLVSHGGTALMVALFELGVLLQISKTAHVV